MAARHVGVVGEWLHGMYVHSSVGWFWVVGYSECVLVQGLHGKLLQLANCMTHVLIKITTPPQYPYGGVDKHRY